MYPPHNEIGNVESTTGTILISSDNIIIHANAMIDDSILKIDFLVGLQDEDTFAF